LIYWIFAQLLFNLREIQYKISARNAVEHFWFCVWKRRHLLRQDFRWYYKISV